MGQAEIDGMTGKSWRECKSCGKGEGKRLEAAAKGNGGCTWRETKLINIVVLFTNI